MIKRLLAPVVLLLLLISASARAQTEPVEAYIYGQPTNCGSSCSTSTLVSGLRILAAPSASAAAAVSIPSNTFVIPSGSYNFTGANEHLGADTQPTCTLTDAATIAWSTTACAGNAAKGVGFNFVTLGGNRTLGCGTGITAGNDGQVVAFYVQQPSSGGPYTLAPTGSCMWPTTAVLSGSNFNLGTVPSEIDMLIGTTLYYGGTTYLVVDNIIPYINSSTSSPVTWNPSDKAANITLSNGNLTAADSANTSNYVSVRATNSPAKTAGKRHFEFTLQGGSTTGRQNTGIANSSASLSSEIGVTDTNGIVVQLNVNDTTLYYKVGGSRTGGFTVSPLAMTDTIAVEVDLGAKLLWFQDVTRSTGWSNASGGFTGNPGAGTGGISFSFAITSGAIPILNFNETGASEQQTVNFGASSFSATVSSGFTAWQSP